MLHSPAFMHIPDGFLSIVVSLALWLATAAVIGYALKRVNADLGERQIPLMGVLAACLFAGQMLNFSVAGGTSGHLMGAALATILLGPWAAMLVLTCVVGVQALIFQDGGLLALGANVFNMAVIGVSVSYAVFQTVRRIAGDRPWGVFVGGFTAAWLSVFTSALAVGLQLALSGTSPANVAIPAMGGIHALIGVGEGLITLGTLAFLLRTRRELLPLGETRPVAGHAVWAAGLLVALALAIASPLASRHPDGLMWVAQQQGFLNSTQSPLYTLFPGYALPGVTNRAWATALAGLLGSLIVFGVALGVAFARRRRPPAAPQ